MYVQKYKCISHFKKCVHVYVPSLSDYQLTLLLSTKLLHGSKGNISLYGENKLFINDLIFKLSHGQVKLWIQTTLNEYL